MQQKMDLSSDLIQIVLGYVSRNTLVQSEKIFPAATMFHYRSLAKDLIKNNPYFIGLSEETVIQYIRTAYVCYTPEPAAKRGDSRADLICKQPDLPLMLYGENNRTPILLTSESLHASEYDPIPHVRNFTFPREHVLVHGFDNSVYTTSRHLDIIKCQPDVRVMSGRFGLLMNSNIIDLVWNTEIDIEVPPDVVDFDIFYSDSSHDEPDIFNFVLLDAEGTSFVISEDDEEYEPALENVRQVLCSYYDTFFLTQEGELYSNNFYDEEGYRLLCTSVLSIIRLPGTRDDENCRILALCSDRTQIFHVPREREIKMEGLVSITGTIYTSSVPRLTTVVNTRHGRYELTYIN